MPTIEHGIIEAENGQGYDNRVYRETTRAVGTQDWVANHWARGDLPTHSTSGDRVVLRSSTDNLRGYQYSEGHGKLVHYSTIEAIRTYSGMIIGNSECWARGFARCTKPNDTDEYIPLTSIREFIKSDEERIYEINNVDDHGELIAVHFDTGSVLRYKDDDPSVMEWGLPGGGSEDTKIL